MSASELTTGLPGLDQVLHGLMPGDSLVWQVESLADFTPFVIPYCQAALAQGRNLIYFRFADHDPLVPESLGATVHELPCGAEFEPFVTEMHRVIQGAGPGAVFVFDCLSTLVDFWHTDRMLGNFFMLAAPSVHDSQSLAYFPLIRHRHSFHASTPIVDTTQVLIDVYRHAGDLYLHPDQGRASFFVHHEHVAQVGRRSLRAGHGKLDDRRNPHLAAVVRPGIGPPPAGQVDPHLLSGGGDLGRHSAGRAAGQGRRPHPPRTAADDRLARPPRRAARRTLSHADRRAGNPQTHDRFGLDRRKIGGHAPRPRDPQTIRPPLERAAGGPRLVLHRRQRVLLLSGRKRLLVAVAEAARPELLPRQHRGGPTPHPGGPLRRLPRPRVRRDARILRPIADHRPQQQPAGGQLRQLLRGQI